MPEGERVGPKTDRASACTLMQAGVTVCTILGKGLDKSRRLIGTIDPIDVSNVFDVSMLQ